MKTHDTTTGIFAALGISITAAIALPLVNVFQSMQPSELMIVRGGVSAILIAIVLTKHLSKPSWYIIKFSVLFSFATLALYASIRKWGASPTLVVLTLTPIVNIVAKLLRGQSVEKHVYGCLFGILLGVIIALNPWQTIFDFWGFLFSLLATLLAGIGFEVLSKSKKINPYNKSFWLSIITAVIGLIVVLSKGQLPFAHEIWNMSHILALVGFGITGGFFYYLANIVAFEKLKTEVASTLAMAETPAVIVGAWIMLDETLSPIQWIGVIFALGATAFLSATENKFTKSIQLAHPHKT